MRKPFLALIVAAALVAMVAVAEAKTKRNHAITGTARIATVSTSKTFPAPGSTTSGASIVQLPGLRGAGLQDTKVTGTTAAGGVTFTGSGTDFFKNGSQTSTNRGTATGTPDGGFTYTGSGRYTSGTGAFKGLTGSFTFTGSSPKPTGTEQTVITLKLKGILRY